MKNWEKVVEGRCNHGKLGRPGGNVSWKAELCDVVDHGLGWDKLLLHVLHSICFKLKQNSVPQFLHLPDKVHGIPVLVVLL